ncbi:MAG: Nif3-like dinuclear metal center hexameric protein [Firmicutes bacterium HGW-Firmicutes-21]|nr:MAG: Nif3-like dinuclear metal center hexameric protein [Firmicutes bacterium HGW-Firmicutes-21]
MSNIKNIIEYFDSVLPKTLSEDWDNDGVMVLPDGNADIKKALIALDATSLSIERAKSIGAELIITHHPLVFSPFASLSADDPYGKRVIECIKNNITVLSYHTRLDEVCGGVGDCFAALAGLRNMEKMQPCGRIGVLENEMSYKEFTEHIKRALGLGKISGVNSNGKIKRVAVIGGSGKDFITDAKKAGADTFLTGEVNHSGLIEAKELGLNVVCGTHYATENIILPRIKELLFERFPDIETVIMPFKAEDEYGV